MAKRMLLVVRLTSRAGSMPPKTDPGHHVLDHRNRKLDRQRRCRIEKVALVRMLGGRSCVCRLDGSVGTESWRFPVRGACGIQPHSLAAVGRVSVFSSWRICNTQQSEQGHASGNVVRTTKDTTRYPSCGAGRTRVSLGFRSRRPSICSSCHRTRRGYLRKVPSGHRRLVIRDMLRCFVTTNSRAYASGSFLTRSRSSSGW